MKIKVIILLILLSISTQIAMGQEPDWMKKMKSITLLSSTRDDVIKLLGQPIDEGKGYWDYFALKEGKIRVSYSVGKCRTILVEGRKVIEGWMVPAWTVVDISFSPNKNSKAEKFKLDFTGFDSYPVYDSVGARIYENDELGIRYSIGSKGNIELISFYPANKYDNLHCK